MKAWAWALTAAMAGMGATAEAAVLKTLPYVFEGSVDLTLGSTASSATLTSPTDAPLLTISYASTSTGITVSVFDDLGSVGDFRITEFDPPSRNLITQYFTRQPDGTFQYVDAYRPGDIVGSINVEDVYSFNLRPIGDVRKFAKGLNFVGQVSDFTDVNEGKVSAQYFYEVSIIPLPAGAAGLGLGIASLLCFRRR